MGLGDATHHGEAQARAALDVDILAAPEGLERAPREAVGHSRAPVDDADLDLGFRLARDDLQNTGRGVLHGVVDQREHRLAQANGIGDAATAREGHAQTKAGLGEIPLDETREPFDLGGQIDLDGPQLQAAAVEQADHPQILDQPREGVGLVVQGPQ